jgi:hypothetical protein
MGDRCAELGCRLATWAHSPFCFGHLVDHVKRSLADGDRLKFEDRIEALLKTLTYREREIVKLRYGLGDGYVYTRAEVGKIFKATESGVRAWEAKALRKLLHPLRFKKLAQFLDIFQLAGADESIVAAVRICESELMAYVSKHPGRLSDVSSDAFERIIAEIMSSMGFEVHLTSKTRDGGRDIVAFSSDRLGVTSKYIVECKRYAVRRPVRVELVRSLYGVKQQQRADHAVLATTSYFTGDSIKFARSPEVWNLHLRDFDAIKDWLATYSEMIQKGAVLL